MITIPGFGDHVRADWPITINGMRTDATGQAPGSREDSLQVIAMPILFDA
jgi:hypothetical protein